ncbi:hypothetical protein ANAPH2_01499 [Anaplasma phagocytophilum]|nr:hypothetical protein ANAPH2_01499 [Anaplasma phagocytophilum]
MWAQRVENIRLRLYCDHSYSLLCAVREIFMFDFVFKVLYAISRVGVDKFAMGGGICFACQTPHNVLHRVE